MDVLTELKKEVGDRYPVNVIEQAAKDAVSKKGETDKALKVARLLVRRSQRGATVKAQLKILSDPMNKWSSMIAAAVEGAKTDLDKAVSDGLCIAYTYEDNGIIERTPAGEERTVNNLPDDAVEIVPEEIYVVPVDSRKMFGPNPNPGWLSPISVTHPRIGVGVFEDDGIIKFGILRINDHFSVPTSEISPEVGVPLEIGSAVMQKTGETVLLNSTADMFWNPIDEFVDSTVFDALTGPKPIPECVVGEKVLICGGVYDIAIRNPASMKSHIVWVAGESLEDDDSIVGFISPDWELKAEIGDEITIVGSVIETDSGKAISVDCFTVG